MNEIKAYPDETGVVLANLEEAIAYGRRGQRNSPRSAGGRAM
jgi:hypothetical protein